MDSVHVIVGLGNPGAEYAQTRHNIGFLLVDTLAGRWGAVWREVRKFEARVAQATQGGRKLFLTQPQTYMNASGQTVRRLVDYYRVPLGQLLVVLDDADLPLGELRLRPGGGTGGHHGLESVEASLGTPEYPRLRLGIGRGAGLREITGHVLGRFDVADRVLVEAVLERAAGQVECWMRDGIRKAMNDFNGRLQPPEPKGTSQ
jgi:PTH1 family peptidyl-tRNA hydrolase